MLHCLNGKVRRRRFAPRLNGGMGRMRQCSLSHRPETAAEAACIGVAFVKIDTPLHPLHHPQEPAMNKDQKDGRIKEVKGTIKEVAGRVTGDSKLENKGKVQNAVGKTQAAYGDAKADVKKALKE